MSLRELQGAIALLVCDRASLDAYARDPSSWLRHQGLPAARGVLDGLDVASLAAFQEIHRRDRAYFLEAVLPLTLARLGPHWPARYFAGSPFADDDVRAEAARFVRHVAAHEDAAAADLARFELAKLLLLDEPTFAPAASFVLRQPTTLRPAPGIAIVPARVRVPELVDDPGCEPTRVAGVALLRRDPDDVTCAWLEGATGEVLAAIARRDVHRLASLAAGDEGRRALVQVIGDGVIA